MRQNPISPITSYFLETLDLGPNSQQMCLNHYACAQNLASGNSPPDPADPADPLYLPETGPAEQNRPSIPRAGGQDDGSLPKLPQIIF